MAGFNYGATRSTASRLIARFGKTTGKLRRLVVTGPEWDPTTTWADVPCKVVETEFAKNEINGTLILASDRKFLMSIEGVGDDPSQRDRLLIGEEELEIVNVWPLAPGDLTILWTLQARGS